MHRKSRKLRQQDSLIDTFEDHDDWTVCPICSAECQSTDLGIYIKHHGVSAINGNHGVVYALPAMFQDGAQHRLRLFAIDDNGARVELNTSNVPFVWAASGPQPAG